MRVTSQKAICLYFKSSLLSTYKWCPEAEKRQRRRWWLFLGAFFSVSENGDKCGTLFFEKNYRRSWEDRLPANENHLIDWKLKGNDRSKSRVKILLKTREKRLRHDSTMTSSSPEASKIVTRFFFSQMSSWILSLSLSLRQMSMSGFFLIRTLNLLNVLPPWILTDIIMIRITWI